MEDILLGRETTTNFGTFANPASVTILPPANKRIRIVVSLLGAAANECRVWPRSAGATTFTGGVVLNANHPTEVLRIEDYGDALREPWLADGGGAGATLTVLDVSLQRDK